MPSDTQARDDAHEAFDAAFKAMTDWRDELRALSELHGERALGKLAEAAKAAGWPDRIVEATRSELLQASKLQADMLDYMTEALRKQLASPQGAPEFLSTLGATPSASHPASKQFAELAMAPTQFWLEATAMWQKSWSEAMATWARGQSPGGQTPGGPRTGGRDGR